MATPPRAPLVPTPLAVTLGDPAGIGPEITIGAWQALRNAPKDISFALIAPADIIARALKAANAPPPIVIDHLDEARKHFASALPVLPLKGAVNIPAFTPGQPSPALAPIITGSIAQAAEYCLSGQASGLVTNPISKAVLYEAGFTHPGHTEYLGQLSGAIRAPYKKGPVMMLVGGGIRVALATIHIPLASVAESLTKAGIIHCASVLWGALKTDFGITSPRIALCGLNPHAGEGGALGREEIDIINPAARALRQNGINITDAQSADTLFAADRRISYDAALAIYHDQGLIPVKTLDFHGGVNATLGLPFIRTSPDHGTAYNLAGSGKARPDSLIAAIKLARDMAGQRQSQLECASHA